MTIPQFGQRGVCVACLGDDRCKTCRSPPWQRRWFATHAGARQSYAALEFYVEVPFKRDLLAPLHGEQAGLCELIERLTFMREAALQPDEPAGCLIINANLELGGRDPRVERIVAKFCDTLREAFLRALSTAERRGELAPGRSPAERAAHLVTMANAFMVLAHVSRTTADDFMQSVIADVQSWQRPAGSSVALPC